MATEAVRRALQYAFDVAGLPRVVGVARAENLASQRVMARAGLTFRRFLQYGGKEAVLYAIENPSPPCGES